MKKILTGILTLVYMTVSSGIAMEIHYCMGKKAGVEFFPSLNDKCGRCGMTEKKAGCCHDEHRFVKIEDSHKNGYNEISFSAGAKAVVTEYPLYHWQMAEQVTLASVNNHSPPDLTGPSAIVMNCVFRL